MNRPLVQVLVREPFLARAMIRALELDLGTPAVLTASEPAEVADGSVVVANVSSCSPEDCRALAERGCTVIILTPVVSAREQGAYRSAGAREYLPMEVARLVPTVRATLDQDWSHDLESTPVPVDLTRAVTDPR